MKKLLGIALALVLMAVVPSPAMAATTVYDDDQAGWEAAVGSWETEDFEDSVVGPGISVTSTNGIVYSQATNKLWYDSLTYDEEPTAWTTFTFDDPIYAFGGTWDLGSQYGDPDVGGPGSNIEVLMDGSWVSVGVIDREYIDVFWGFVSTTPFTQVRLQGYNDEGWTERYTLDDMVYSFSPQVEVDKVWTMTNVCFEVDNDRDGLLSEDWEDDEDNDGDGLIDEDPDECCASTTGTVIDELEALVKNGKIHTVTPGQFYAMSTVTIGVPVDELVIEENWGHACGGCQDMFELNPKKGGGQVIVVYWNGADWEQIYDAMDPEVDVDAENGLATVTLTDVDAGTYLVLVKFSAKKLKGEDFEGQSCTNWNSATATIGAYEESDSASATLTVVERVPE
jgi:hypothetical protein